jgi:mannose-1-phosphate guanylyltransferase
VRPDRPDPGLGYIVPGRAAPQAERVGGASVRGFEEKPAPSRAAAIMRDGALWSSFIMLFRVQRMLALVRSVRPREMEALERVVDGPATIAAGYRELSRWNFSHDVLARCPQELLVVAADDLGWSDWGTPEAVAQTFTTLGLAPPWLSATPSTAQIPTG